MSKHVSASDHARAHLVKCGLPPIRAMRLVHAFEAAVAAAAVRPSAKAHGMREGLWQALIMIGVELTDTGNLEREVCLRLRAGQEAEVNP